MTREAPAGVVALVGATATGKTALGEALAEALGAEVVCADSRQVFGELSVGTGKPSAIERGERIHHLFEALDLEERPSAGWYAAAAAAAREQVRGRGRLPLLVGGSGLYLRAAQRGLSPQPPHDPVVRARLLGELEALGPEALHQALTAVDAATAARLAPRDRQRIVRALEVHRSSGRPLSWWHERPAAAPPPERWGVIEIVLPPARLRERVERRTRWMLENGLIEETRALAERGRAPALSRLQAVGYDEVLAMLGGSVPASELAARIDTRTLQLAKRQRTWFRHQSESLKLDGEGRDMASLLDEALARLARAGFGPPR